MNNKLKKLEGTYWIISKIAGVLFTLFCYQMWTEPFNVIKAVLLIISVSIVTFITINFLDLILGMIAGIVKHIKKTIKDRRIFKSLGKVNDIEEMQEDKILYQM